MASLRGAAAFVLCLLAAGPARAELSVERIGTWLPLDRATLQAAPLFSYGDLAAYRASARFAAAGAGDPAQAAQRRWLGFADLTLNQEDGAQPGAGLRRATGIDYDAVRRVLSFGDPPDQVLVIAGTAALAPPAAVAAALEPRGFARSDEAGTPVWHRFDDHAMEIARRDPDDPFGGMLGRSARIAVRPGEVIGTAAWPRLRSVLDAADGRAPNLGATAELAAVLHGVAVTAAAAALTPVRATGFHVMHTGLVDDVAALLDRPIEEIREAWTARLRRSAGERLPPYALAVIADLAGSAGDGGVIALSYGTQADAAAAAAILRRRLGAADAPGDLASRRARLDARVVALPAPLGGRSAWAAVAIAAYPTDPAVPPAALAWLDQIYRRSFQALSLEPQ